MFLQRHYAIPKAASAIGYCMPRRIRGSRQFEHSLICMTFVKALKKHCKWSADPTEGASKCRNSFLWKAKVGQNVFCFGAESRT